MTQQPIARRRRPDLPYVDRAELAACVRQYRRSGEIGDALGKMLMTIAHGVWERYHFTESLEDFIGDAVLHLLGSPLKNADPKDNVFGYFFTCTVRYGLKLRDRAAAERRRTADVLDQAAEDLLGRAATSDDWVAEADRRMDAEAAEQQQLDAEELARRRRRLLRKKHIIG